MMEWLKRRLCDQEHMQSAMAQGTGVPDAHGASGAYTGSEEEAMLKSMGDMIALNTGAMARLTAGNVVAHELINAVLPLLDAAQRSQAEAHFRQSAERLLSLSDDVPLPAVYHATLLDEINACLAKLHNNSPAAQQQLR